MRTIAKNFGWRQGAGYYSWHQCGSHEDTHQGVWYEGDEQSLMNDDGVLELPPFAYWEDDTPVCDSYRREVILVTGSPWQDSREDDIIVYEVQYDENYDYSGNVAEAFLEMYHADCFKYVK